MKHLRSACDRRTLWRVGAVVAVATLIALAWIVAPHRAAPLTPAAAARVEALARDTGSPEVWRVYEAERRDGLTARGAARVREAAKATPPPYGLISDREAPR